MEGHSGAILQTVKAAEDGNGLVVRFYEAHGGRGMVRTHLNFPVESVKECNAVEEPVSNAEERLAEDGSFSFFIAPFQIRTFRILRG